MNLAERREAVRAALCGQEEVQLLLEGLLLADRFGLYLVESPSEGVTDALLALIVERFAEEGFGTDVKRLSGRWGAPFAELVVEVLEPLRRGEGETDQTLWVLDASASLRSHEVVWTPTLARMNEIRNAIVRSLTRPVLLVLPPWLSRRLPELAPDLWSIRVMKVRPLVGPVLPVLAPLLLSVHAPFERDTP